MEAARLIGETGGKDFIVAHRSADLDALAAACVRGAYEYQGQKCAAPSRLYVPRTRWPALKQRLVDLTRQVVVGDPTEPDTHVGAVINAAQFRKHAEALARARAEDLVVVGGNTDDATGWFVDPTVLEVTDPLSPFMTEELFAPVLAAYVYDDTDWDDTLRLVDESTVYGLTGAVFATDEDALAQAGDALRYTAGQLIHQRQADRCGRRATTVRRVAGVGHQRQGRDGLEPDPVCESPCCQTQRVIPCRSRR